LGDLIIDGLHGLVFLVGVLLEVELGSELVLALAQAPSQARGGQVLLNSLQFGLLSCLFDNLVLETESGLVGGLCSHILFDAIFVGSTND
jgi:hypothetical protein